jgi:hypothetical protein
VTDQQQRALTAHSGYSVKGLMSLEVTRERLVQLHSGTPIRAHLGQCKLGGFARAHLRASQYCREAHAHPRQRETYDFSLPATTLGQATLSIRARAVWLRVGVAKQPKLAGRCHGLLRA